MRFFPDMDKHVFRAYVKEPIDEGVSYDAEDEVEDASDLRHLTVAIEGKAVHKRGFVNIKLPYITSKISEWKTHSVKIEKEEKSTFPLPVFIEQGAFWDLVVTLRLKGQPEPVIAKIPFQVQQDPIEVNKMFKLAILPFYMPYIGHEGAEGPLKAQGEEEAGAGLLHLPPPAVGRGQPRPCHNGRRQEETGDFSPGNGRTTPFPASQLKKHHCSRRFPRPPPTAT